MMDRAGGTQEEMQPEKELVDFATGRDRPETLTNTSENVMFANATSMTIVLTPGCCNLSLFHSKSSTTSTWTSLSPYQSQKERR